ncbi:unnamed protein product [Euphydryas editha]|uniref:Transposase n=1 Tax=Euphydryas editha TaxID=104508 RepID=A0AAU9TRC1_EUPED|nr:unnamed protein product [Euphydryas editha]
MMPPDLCQYWPRATAAQFHELLAEMPSLHNEMPSASVALRGRPRAISDRDRRAILRVASNSTLTANQIASAAGVITNVRNVQRLLHGVKHLSRKKVLKKPPLGEKHKKERLQFAEDHIAWKKKWRYVIFSDEKKFNLDGPDGYKYYYHDLRKDELILSRRQFGGGSVMCWAAIGFEGKTEIIFISGKINSQDNAAVHTANFVKDYFSERNIQILTWPARSPDLNIIENCWGKLARAVYLNGKQYNNVEQLKNAIQDKWNKLDQNYIKNLYETLPKRLIKVVKNRGGSTHY